MRMQPALVFNSEITRINHLYWNSSYCVSRTKAILGAIASVGRVEEDPRVDALWPSTIEGEARQLTVPRTAFDKRTDTLLGNLRTTAILHACSAFETALVGYFCIGLLYSPSAVVRFKRFSPAPTLLRSQTAYQRVLTEGPTIARGCLGAEYSKRLTTIIDRFNLTTLDTKMGAQLDAHYERRHSIAHTQSLDGNRFPNWSHKEILALELKISEPEWKSMLADFHSAVRLIDECFQLEVVTDSFRSIAIDRIVRTRGAMKVHAVRSALQHQWAITATNRQTSASAVAAGLRVTPHKRVEDRRIFV
jgi:hypothetical protein